MRDFKCRKLKFLIYKKDFYYSNLDFIIIIRQLTVSLSTFYCMIIKSGDHGIGQVCVYLLYWIQIFSLSSKTLQSFLCSLVRGY